MKIIYEKTRTKYVDGSSGKIEEYEKKQAQIRLVETGDYYLLIGSVDEHAYENIIMGMRKDAERAPHGIIEDAVYIATHEDFEYLHERCEQGAIIET